MANIQTSTGLITGVPIQDTVDKLVAISARPRDLLLARMNTLKQQQMAFTELSATLLAVQFAAGKLGKDDVYRQLSASSSNNLALGATVTGQPAKGSYQVTPVRTAQRQQWLSSGLLSASTPLGAGSLSFRYGDHVQRSAPLEVLNGGAGFTRGKIRITDRSGASAEIDLSTATTLDDVLNAINGNSAVNVEATIVGDRIRLIDHTGQTLSNLKVQEAGGTTAASLGLAGIDVAADTADGQDPLWLAGDIAMASLNDGNGVDRSRVLSDIRYQLRDGTTGEIDLSPIIPGGAVVDEELTVGELLEVLNAAAPGKLQFQIASDGKRFVVTDLTTGEGDFSLTAINDSEALGDLGLDVAAVDGVITGRRVLGGLNSVLLRSLHGGSGVGQLGLLALTDRSGATATVDLAAAETLDQVVASINGAGVGIVARVNKARNGIELIDTTGLGGNLVVANGDATATADKLGIAIDAAANSVNSGDLHLQVIANQTKLASLNGGAGVARGTFTIVDTFGRQTQIDLSRQGLQTVGDLVREINRLCVGVHAELNATGDGILLRDLAQGGAELKVIEGNSTTAADLHLLRTARRIDIGGRQVQAIDGTATVTIELDADDSLEDLRQKINAAGNGVQATILNDGSGRPYRLSLVSGQPGSAGELVLDTSGLLLNLEEMVHGQDALLVLGQGASGVLAASPSNRFQDVLAGLTLEIKQPSATPVTVTVSTSDAGFVAAVEALVKEYNAFREKLNKQMAYDAATDTAAVLSADPAALRLDAELSRLLSGRIGAPGGIRGLGELGIRLTDDGTLQLDKQKLQEKYAADPEKVKRFFADPQAGLAARLDQLIDQLAGEGNSLLAQRLDSLSRRLDADQDKVDFLNERLARERERLLAQFYQMELTIGKLQSNLSVLGNLQILTPLVSTSQRNG